MTAVRAVTAATAGTHERGWVALVMVTWTTVVLLLSLLGLAAATDVLAARARAQTAADAAALAAVGASPLVGGTQAPVQRAREAADRNGAELVSCRCDDLRTAAVVAAVRPRMPWVAAVAPRVSARAEAQLVADRSPPLTDGRARPAAA